MHDELPDFLRHRPRRSPVGQAPPHYFDTLPERVLTRIRATETAVPRASSELFLLPSWPRLRLALTSAVLSSAFVAAFWLVRPTALGPARSADPMLTTVSHGELVEYLADPATVRLMPTDLTSLSTADYDADAALLNVPTPELDQALDEYLVDETYL